MTSDAPSKPVRAAGVTPVIWVAAVTGVVIVCFAAVMRLVVIDRVDPDGGAANVASLRPYWALYAVTWGALSVLAWRLSRQTHRPSVTPRAGTPPVATPPGSWWGSGAGVAVIILGVALAARLLTLSTTTPHLSDDIWRYIHDGRRLATGHSPYGASPLELGAGRGDDTILNRVNHPDLVTIYQPASQYVFAMLWRLRPAAFDPLGLYTFRAGFVLFDMAIIMMLLALLHRQRRPLWWAALYAWHPLAISEVAGAGHQDVIGIASLVAALMLIQQPEPRPSSRAPMQHRLPPLARAVGCGVAFAVSVAVKPIVLPLAIPMAVVLRRNTRLLCGTVIGAVLAAAVLYLPLMTLGGGMGRVFDTADTFIQIWAFNSSIHAPLSDVIDSSQLANKVVFVVLMLTLAWSVIQGDDLWQSARVYLFAGLLLSSVVHPWYLLWALVFVPLHFGPGVWVMSLTVAWSYAVFGDVARWELPTWLIVVEYLPVYGTLAWCGYRFIQSRYPSASPVCEAGGHDGD